ncbi:MAG: ABC transporter permease [Chromatiales bacterium]|nr:ABC transporter permease [Gammaproteobacteria bacterium]MBW6476550.1 ABC transporter permease [Chromatiales bacterium]
MNLFRLSLSWLRAQPLNTALNLLLLALGMATITLILLLGHQLQDRLSRDAQGIDLVLGAKGSPLQIILANLYHLDVPTGNIPLHEAMQLSRDPLVARAIPIALGDNYRGYRIVGSSHDYPRHYAAGVTEGRLWRRPMEVVIGHEVARSTGLKVGDHFDGTHGLSKGGELHGDQKYKVVGILHRNASVIDRLVLTSVESVWAVHEKHDHDHNHAAERHDDEVVSHNHDYHGHGHADAHHPAPDEAATGHHDGLGLQEATPDRQITAVLIQYRSPLAAALLPRQINARGQLQAAVPAVELSRLLQLLGIGMDTLRLFGLLLILSAGLSMFIALYNNLRERQYDLAVLRSLGASRLRLMNLVLLEGVILAVLGTLLGLAGGHLAAELIGQWLPQAQQLDLRGFIWLQAEWGLLLFALLLGLLAALIPALSAYRSDIARILARG